MEKKWEYVCCCCSQNRQGVSVVRSVAEASIFLQQDIMGGKEVVITFLQLQTIISPYPDGI